MSAYYNEFDPGAAAWLRELIANHLIAPGDVDERSIKDVQPDDLRGYAQCHFFAGIGVWSHALRRAGWEDERPVWTGSCPCQPFSGAGKGEGFDDPRHLWPDWFRIIAECRPDRVLGEQVASASEWLNLVQSQLEDLGYAFAAVDLPAAGFAMGAHIRQRFYWVADADHAERWADLAPRHFGDWPATGRIEGYGQPGAGGAAGGLADVCGDERRPGRDDRAGDRAPGELAGLCVPGGMGHHHHHPGPQVRSWGPDERGAIRVEGAAPGASGSLRGCDWLFCHDGRVRPVESGTFPLVVKTAGRVAKLRGLGNALDAETATQFIAAYMEAAEVKAIMAELT